jgi:hypothetical protein
MLGGVPPIDGRPDEAYGRVTNPERYAAVVDAARTMLDNLSNDYGTDRVEGLDVDRDLVTRSSVRRVVRLTPRGGDGGPLTFAFTDFPGVLVRFGRSHVEAFPSCGCDACDEVPADVIERLARAVDQFVAGGFSEGLEDGWLFHAARRIRGAMRLDRASEEAFDGDFHKTWGSWPQ